MNIFIEFLFAVGVFVSSGVLYLGVIFFAVKMISGEWPWSE